MKKNRFLIIPIFFLIFSYGCLNNGQAENQKQENRLPEENNDQQTLFDQGRNWEENFLLVNIDDLTAGNQVIVFGVENSDGIISAQRIVMAQNPADLEEIGKNFGMQNQQIPSEQGANRQRPDFENMTEEQRIQLREQMTQRGGTMRGGRPTSGQNILNIHGEIIAKDESSITVKSIEGGSKFVLISGSTIILQPKN